MSDSVVWEIPLEEVPDVGDGDAALVTGAEVGAVVVGGALEGGAGGDGTDAGAAGVETNGEDVVFEVGFAELGLGAQASSSNPLVAGTGAELVFTGRIG